MSWGRISGLVLRHLINWKRSLNRLTDTFWWPVVGLLVWGLFTVYAKDMLPSIVLWLLGALVFWIIIQRSQNEISVSLMDEIWSENLLNLFTTPLSFAEFLIGLMVVSVVKLALSIATIIITAFVLYQYNIFTLGFYFVPFTALLIVFGWTLGIVINSMIIRFGRDSEALAWTAIVAVQPFSCVFYPLSTLPKIAQEISLLLPSTYIFEGLRALVYSGSLPSFYLFMATLLSLVYFILSIFIFKRMFTLSKQTGLLARLME